MSTGVLPFSAILGKQSTKKRSHASSVAEPRHGDNYSYEPRLAHRPDVDVICAHARIYSFHLAVNIQRAHFPARTCVTGGDAAGRAKENG